MKKTLTLMLGLLMIGTMALVSCAKKDSPKAAFENFANSLIKGDYENPSVIDFYVGKEELTPDEKQAVARELRSAFEESGGIKSCEVLDEKLSKDGQSAGLRVKTVMNNGDVNEDIVALVKTEKGWVMDEM